MMKGFVKLQTHVWRLNLFLAAVVLVDVRACPSGWFGRECMLQCHCAQSQVCDVNGDCPITGRCATGYFGPGCQFVDLVASDGHSSVETYLKDNDDGTCNSNTGALIVPISLTRIFPFTWMRIVVKNSAVLMNFTIVLGGTEECRTMRKFKISETIVDVTCALYNFRDLSINGRIAPAVCGVYISGGRNLALKQSAEQSNDFVSEGYVANADRAVDGNTSPRFEDRSCSRTREVNSGAVWNLTFSDPPVLYRLRFYNRNSYDNRLHRFVVETRSVHNNLLTTYTDNSASPQAVYDILVPNQTPVRLLTIRQSLTVGDKILTLCEVQTFGELPCQDTYGLRCEERCHCKRLEICHVATGACAVGCPPGLYGINCTSRCKGICARRACALKTGECAPCEPGRTGLVCDKECTPGRYGQNCNSICSGHCLDICNPETGACKCNIGFTGSICEDCEPGWFGGECTHRCPMACNDSCDQTTGNCFSCKGNYAGPNCTDCITWYYGSSCSNRCPEHCLQGICDKKTGACSGCQPGFFGDDCSADVDEIMHYLYQLPILIILVACLSMCVCIRKKKSLAAPVSEGPPKMGRSK